MKSGYLSIVVAALSFFVAGCSQETPPAPEVQLVSQEVPVTVEVTRVVNQVVTVEVPVEVTRLVEIEPMPAPTAVIEPTAVLTETAVTAAEAPLPGKVYTVVAGDNLSLISAKTGATNDEIKTANSLTSSFLAVGQELFIPGWSGEIEEIAYSIVEAPAGNEPQPGAGPVVLVPVGPNLLPNPSFEGDWYFFNNVAEWQISTGWALSIDEGPNTLTPEEGDRFLRPEVRVVSKANLPSSEHSLFVFDGNKTIKIFKGGAPTSFAVFANVALEPGTYRFTINFFPDIVSVYRQGKKVWATDQLAAEVRFIHNDGGSDWVTPTPGVKNTLTYEFTLEEAATIQLGAAFRNRFVNSNNGWFLDNWILQRLEPSE